jgi:hypothetical protein
VWIWAEAHHDEIAGTRIISFDNGLSGNSYPVKVGALICFESRIPVFLKGCIQRNVRP